MSALFTALSNYLNSTSTQTVLTFQDEKSSVTVEVNLPLMKTLTKVFDDTKFLATQKVNKVNDFKDFFEYVHGRKVDLTPKELAVFHNCADFYQMTSIAKELETKVTTLSFPDIMKVYDDCKFNGVHPSMSEMMRKKIMREMGALNFPEYNKYVDLGLIKMLIDRKDYELHDLHYQTNLEACLLEMLLHYFEVTYPVHTAESRIDFMECFNKIQLDTALLSSGILTTSCAGLVYGIMSRSAYKDDVLQKELAPKFLEQMKNAHLKTVPRPQRHIAYRPTVIANKLMEFEKKLMQVDEVMQLKQGDLLDVQDCQQKWYLGKIEQVIPETNSVIVSFTGWSVNDNELIVRTTKRFAKRATFTNGKEHIVVLPTTTSGEPATKCDCGTCISKGLPSMNKAYIDLITLNLGSLVGQVYSTCGNPNCTNCKSKKTEVAPENTEDTEDIEETD
jgi:hypothetical protein